MSASANTSALRLARPDSLPAATSRFDWNIAWMALFFSSGPLGSFLSESSHQSGTLALQLLWATLYCLVFVAAARNAKSRTVLRKHKLLIAVVLLVLLSVFWSVDPQITLRRSFGLLGSTLIGVFVGSRFSVRDQLRLLRSILFVGLVLSLLTVILLPSSGIMSASGLEGTWCGIYGHKNALGHITILLILVSYLLRKSNTESSRKTTLAMVLAAFLLIMSQSISSVVVIAIIAASIPLIRAFQQSRWRVFLIAGLSLAAGFSYVLMNLTQVLELMGKDVTLTGRLPLWIMEIAAMASRPWLGFGFSAFFESENPLLDAIARGAGWHAGNAHNGFLQVALDIGVTGLVLVSLLLGRVVWRAVKKVRSDHSTFALWPVLFLCLFLICNLDEALILTYNNLYWELFVAVLVVVSLPKGHAGRRARLTAKPINVAHP